MSTSKHIYIATPCYGCMMTNAYAIGILKLQAACSQRGIVCSVDFMGNESLITRGRSILAGRFLTSTATHLLFIDADIGFEPDVIFRLLDADKDVGTAIYPKKHIDWDIVKTKMDSGSAEPVHQMGLDFNLNLLGNTGAVEKGLVRVLDAATGLMLIRRNVIECMSDRYRDDLECINDIAGTRERLPKYVAIFDCMIDPESRRYLSEDYSFCRRCQAMGFEIYADISSTLCHVGNMTFSGDIHSRRVSGSDPGVTGSDPGVPRIP